MNIPFQVYFSILLVLVFSAWQQYILWFLIHSIVHLLKDVTELGAHEMHRIEVS